MADLVTHLCTALLPGAIVRHRVVPVVAIGTVVPDAVSRIPGELLELAHAGGVPVPPTFVEPWGVTHEPIPLLLICTATSLLFRAPDRRAVLGGLLGGCALHIGLDLLQDHHGHGYRLLFPFSRAQFELGLLHSEITVAWAPWLALATVLAWAARAWHDRRTRPPAVPQPGGSE